MTVRAHIRAVEPPRYADADPADARSEALEAVRAAIARHSRAALAVKRLGDVALAAAGLGLSAPLLVALGVLIRLESPGPVLYRQRRTGRGGRVFTLVKLRTMRDREESDRDEPDRDRHVTRLGRLLRPTGIDELPQLWNVLKGEMSLIGPRPELPDRVERWASMYPGYGLRHALRPGITGWAQVNGIRGDVSIADRLRFDLAYLRDFGLALDAQILLRTVPTVVRDTRRSLKR